MWSACGSMGLRLAGLLGLCCWAVAEGAPSTNTTFRMLEKIRRQLMEDNYDYVTSEEDPFTLSPHTDAPNDSAYDDEARDDNYKSDEKGNRQAGNKRGRSNDLSHNDGRNRHINRERNEISVKGNYYRSAKKVRSQNLNYVSDDNDSIRYSGERDYKEWHDNDDHTQFNKRGHRHNRNYLSDDEIKANKYAYTNDRGRLRPHEKLNAIGNIGNIDFNDNLSDDDREEIVPRAIDDEPEEQDSLIEDGDREVVSKKDLLYYMDDERLRARRADPPDAATSSTAKYKIIKLRGRARSRRSGRGARRLVQERSAAGVALLGLDAAPLPLFRLPRSRRQYMREREHDQDLDLEQEQELMPD